MTDAVATDWKTWRRTERERLLAERSALSSADRQELTQRVAANLDRALERLSVRVLGIYWPIKREMNLLGWAGARSAEHGFALALPVVAEPRTPLEYWHWHPAARMTRGFWNIPVPVEKTVVRPDAVIAPLVGFCGCWRLGYGGGYFDRTLAASAPRPAAIGVGLDRMQVSGFRPEPHDVPMTFIVTESRLVSAGA